MHISNCLHPKKIMNPYTHEIMYVPCGRCSACLNAKSLQWIQRLDCECRMHKYTLFGTLTYDNENLPILSVLGDCLYDPSDRHASDRPRVSFNIKDLSPSKADLSYLKSQSSVGVPYLSHYHAQCFIKRLRINLFRLCQKNNINVEESLLRFYLVGEYGPKNYRPHFHFLLWFDSDFTAKNIQSLLAKSWSFGYINSSFVKNSANTYVAKYLNCVTHLPAVLRYREVRPFAHFSKCPPIGSHFINDETVQKIWSESSPSMLYFDAKKRKFVDVPLWRFLEDRIFPRCSRFSDLSHSDRVALYRIAPDFQECFSGSEDFVCWCRSSFFKESFPKLYSLLENISSKFSLDSPLYRLYYISMNVWSMSSFYRVSIDTYVKHIEDYYNNVEYEKLKKQFSFQEQYSDKYGCSPDLVWFDRFWLDSLLPKFNNDDLLFQQSQWDSIRPLYLNDKKLCMQLESFGIDLNKFFASDLTDCKAYFDSLALSRSRDYLDYTVNMDKIQKDSTKTKKKNDCLSSNNDFSKSDLYGKFISRFKTEF